MLLGTFLANRAVEGHGPICVKVQGDASMYAGKVLEVSHMSYSVYGPTLKFTADEEDAAATEAAPAQE